MNVLSVPNWTVNFSSFHIDISLRKKKKKNERESNVEGETGEWNYKTGLGQFHCIIYGKSSFPSWTNGGIILASFRNSEDWKTIKSELLQDSVRLLLGVQSVHPKNSWVKVVVGMLYMCILTCNFLSRHRNFTGDFRTLLLSDFA